MDDRGPEARLPESGGPHRAGPPHSPGLRGALARISLGEHWYRVDRRDVLLVSLLATVVLLIILNVVTLIQLRQVEQLPYTLLGGGAEQVMRLRTETFTYTLRIDQPVRIQADVPINRTLDVPIDTTVPISTVLNVPVDSVFGPINLAVPIRTTLPVSLTAQVPISETLNVDTTVPIRTDLPIAIRLEDTPLKPYLEQLERLLRQAR